MIKFLRRLFYGKQEEIDTVQYLSEASADVVDIFTNTVDSLSMINEDVDLEIQERSLIIEELLQENKKLSEVKERNTKVIDKINKIFEE